jgi:hypothetical protein
MFGSFPQQPINRTQAVINALSGALNALGYALISMTVDADRVHVIATRLANAVPPDLVKSLTISIDGVIYTVENVERAYFVTDDEMNKAVEEVRSGGEEVNVLAELMMKMRTYPVMAYHIVFKKAGPNEVEAARAITIEDLGDEVRLTLPPNSNIELAHSIDLNTVVTRITIITPTNTYTLMLNGAYAFSYTTAEPTRTTVLLRKQH